jgi:hypothetical protein
MWASQDATLPRTAAKSGPVSLGQPLLGRNRLPGVAFDQALQGKVRVDDAFPWWERDAASIAEGGEEGCVTDPAAAR